MKASLQAAHELHRSVPTHTNSRIAELIFFDILPIGCEAVSYKTLHNSAALLMFLNHHTSLIFLNHSQLAPEPRKQRNKALLRFQERTYARDVNQFYFQKSDDVCSVLTWI